MQISYSQKDTQSILAIVQQSALKKSPGDDQNGSQNTTGSASSEFQASLAATAPGQTSGMGSSSAVINPIEYMTSSDIDLWEKVTGGTISDGTAYLPDGTEGFTEDSSNLASAIYEMRAHGTFDAFGNRLALSGDITVQDLQGYIEHYQNGGWFDSDTSVLDDTMRVLTEDQA